MIIYTTGTVHTDLNKNKKEKKFLVFVLFFLFSSQLVTRKDIPLISLSVNQFIHLRRVVVLWIFFHHRHVFFFFFLNSLFCTFFHL